ncbi:iucA / IucC family protein [Geobacillus kaustophilus]|uniref:IucA / IucC family protein n=1 Tax=Geobacillus kaustophilus TaxID=1462 RepID=A0A0D8BY77_GEOKU|nr:IucA/IucC family protein [Geobacillus kaustophilus]KJE29156.1 iucA / IucC family protein [Geobacillus kaustophilus]
MNTRLSLRTADIILYPYEQECAEFIQKRFPECLSAYVRHVMRARTTILQRTVAALLREDVFGLYSHSYDLQVIGSVYMTNWHRLAPEWESVVHRLPDANLQEGITYKLFPVASGQCFLIPIRGESAFRQCDIGEEVVWIGEGIQTVRDALSFLSLLTPLIKAAGEEQAWAQLAKELENGTSNLALAYWHFEKECQTMRKEADNLFTYIEQRQIDPSFCPALFFEQLCIEGHHLHPSAKTKLPMSPKDVFAYSAEFGGQPQLRIVAVRRHLCDFHFDGYKDPNTFLLDHFPSLRGPVAERFQQTKKKLEDYVLVPVHPWQYEHVIPNVYREELRDGRLWLIEGAVIPTQATASFRTVLAKEAPLYIKTAVHSQMTSTVRSISSQSANNGATYSRLLRTILERERDLSAIFLPVCEIGGCSFRSKDPNKARNLSVIYREGLDRFVDEGEIAIAGTALYASSPFSGQPIINDIIEAYAKGIGRPSSQETALSFLHEYVGIAVRGFLTLLVKYGIGLEGHLQNTVPVFRQGKPMKLLFRDWGGIRLYRPRLERQGFNIDVRPDSITITDDLREAQNKVFYTVFQNQLGEIIRHISRQWGIAEEQCWICVRRQCDEVFAKLAKDPNLKRAVHEDRQALYRPHIDHKALAKMRLQPKAKTYCFVSVPNPLAMSR